MSFGGRTIATSRPERRLAAILAADVVGYSRLIEQDEAATLAAIRELRRDVIDPLLTEHHGRMVKLMGDGAVVEFASVVDAEARSAQTRRDYLARIAQARADGIYRSTLSCGNLAHGFAACSPSVKAKLAGNKSLNLEIVTSYNDMPSAHQPYQFYPNIIKDAARSIGAAAAGRQRRAGHVPTAQRFMSKLSKIWT